MCESQPVYSRVERRHSRRQRRLRYLGAHLEGGSRAWTLLKVDTGGYSPGPEHDLSSYPPSSKKNKRFTFDRARRQRKRIFGVSPGRPPQAHRHSIQSILDPILRTINTNALLLHARWGLKREYRHHPLRISSPVRAWRARPLHGQGSTTGRGYHCTDCHWATTACQTTLKICGPGRVDIGHKISFGKCEVCESGIPNVRWRSSLRDNVRVGRSPRYLKRRRGEERGETRSCFNHEGAVQRKNWLFLFLQTQEGGRVLVFSWPACMDKWSGMMATEIWPKNSIHIFESSY